MADLKTRRVKFSKLVSELVLWVNAQPDWAMCYDEVRVHPQRKVRLEDGKLMMVQDAMHVKKSYHYDGLAADLNLYVYGEYISRGDHPVWQAIGKKWLSLDPECTWGDAWDDANHVSLGEGK